MDERELFIVGVVVGLAAGLLVAFWFASAGLTKVEDDGYRRGYCEGRGGVEATVGDSIRCIRPPVAVDTVRGR